MFTAFFCVKLFKTYPFGLCPGIPGLAGHEGTAHRPGKPVQGFILRRSFNLNKMLKAIFGSLQSLTMLALFHGGCGRGIDPYLVGHTLY